MTFHVVLSHFWGEKIFEEDGKSIVAPCIIFPLSHGHGGGVQHDEPELHPKLKESHAEDGHAHGYQVFHMEFERVELPFIIALWIFVSSLAKIGTDD